jgi:CRISPR-associated endonuclease Csn1
MTRNPKIAQRWTLGLDFGIASVGWAVLAEDHIIDLGVRAFDKAETASAACNN